MAEPFGHVVMAWGARLRLVRRSELRCDATCKVIVPVTSPFPGTKDSTLHGFEVAGVAGRADAITTDGSLEARNLGDSQRQLSDRRTPRSQVKKEC